MVKTSKIFIIKLIDFEKREIGIKILLIIINLCMKKTSECLLLKAI